MSRMSFDHLLVTEQETILFTRSYLKGAHDNIPHIIDVLLQLIYFTGPEKNIDTNEGEFHSYCWHQYLGAPYSLRACYILYERGYYLEATFILRHLIEMFVKIRYFQKHKNLVKSIWANKKPKITLPNGKKKDLTIKVIFDDISPSYYEKDYGKLFSGFLHGRISSIFRVDRKSSTKGTVRMGAKFIERYAGFILNNFVAFSYGYLNWFPKFFPDGFATIGSDLLEQYKKNVTWLKGSMNKHKKEQLSSLSWYQRIEKIIL